MSKYIIALLIVMLLAGFVYAGYPKNPSIRTAQTTYSDTPLDFAYFAGRHYDLLINTKFANGAYDTAYAGDNNTKFLIYQLLTSFRPDDSDTLDLWKPILSKNIGQPDSARYIICQGSDPVDQSYSIYARDFTLPPSPSNESPFLEEKDFLVLFRPANGEIYDNSSAVTVNLPRDASQVSGHSFWVEILPDGTYGEPTTTASIRNVEGKIFMKATADNYVIDDGNILWSWKYGNDSLYEEGRSIRKTTDGGYIMAGWGYNNPGRNIDVYVIKTDSNGVLEWERKYGGASDDKSFCVQEMHNGNFIVAGYTESSGAGGEDIYVLILNTDGDSLLAKTYGGSGNDIARYVLQTSDSNYVLFGYTQSFGGADQDFYIYKIDGAGDSVWAVYYSGSNNLDWLVYGIEKENGNYIASGLTGSPEFGDDSCAANRPDGFYCEIDYTNGDTLWTRHDGGDSWSEHYSVQYLKNGDLLLGSGDIYIPVWKTKLQVWPSMSPRMLIADSSDGSPRYFHLYKYGNNLLAHSYIYSWQQLENGNILGAGRYNDLGGWRDNASGDGLVMLTDDRGNLIKWDRIGSTGGDSFFDFAIADDGVVLFGTSNKDKPNETKNSGDFWMVKYAPQAPTVDGGIKPMLVLFDSLEVSSQQCWWADSADIIFQMLHWGGYVYDSLCLGDYADEMFGDTVGASYGVKKQAFRDYIDDYSVILIPETGIATVGDSSSASPPRGLQQYMISAIVDWIYRGGALINMDASVIPFTPDSLGYGDMFGWAASGAATTDSIIIYGNNDIYGPYIGYNNRDSTQIDGLKHDGQEITNHIVLTELGDWVDTLVVGGEGTDRPLIIAGDYGLGGYAVQWLCRPQFYYHLYDANDSLTRIGAGCGYDYLLFAQLDYALSRKFVSANFEMQGLYGALVDDIIGNDSLGTDGYRSVLGSFIELGVPVRNSMYIGRYDATDSASLQYLNTSGLLSNSYQSYDERSHLFIDATDTTEWGSGEWLAVMDTIADWEDSSGRGSGLIIEKQFKPNWWAWGWGCGTDSCVWDSLIAHGVTFTDCREGPWPRDYPLSIYGRPYESKFFVADWMADSVEVMHAARHNMWQYGFFRPNANWTPGNHYDPWIAGFQHPVGGSDSIASVRNYVREYIEGAWTAKAGGVIYMHAQYPQLGGSRWIDSIMPYIADTLSALNAVLVPALYIEQLSCYRDSVYVEDYRADQKQVSFKLRHIYKNGTMPIPLYYTVRRVMPDNTINVERVFIPSGWSDEIVCRSEYTKSGWRHSPGFKSGSDNIRAEDISGTGGWFD